MTIPIYGTEYGDVYVRATNDGERVFITAGDCGTPRAELYPDEVRQLRDALTSWLGDDQDDELGDDELYLKPEDMCRESGCNVAAPPGGYCTDHDPGQPSSMFGPVRVEPSDTFGEMCRDTFCTTGLPHPHSRGPACPAPGDGPPWGRARCDDCGARPGDPCGLADRLARGARAELGGGEVICVGR